MIKSLREDISMRYADRRRPPFERPLDRRLLERRSTKPQPLTHGLTKLQTNLSPDKAAAQVASQEMAYYDKIFRPLNRQLMSEVDSTAIVDAARDSLADIDPAKAAARSTRQAARFGLGSDALSLERAARTADLSQATDADGLVNNARVAQHERNLGLREELAAIGRGIATSGAGSLSTAANLQQQRKLNNQNIDAQNSASQAQMMGSLAAIALAFF